MLNVENVIVGAGPYGLSIAAHFRAQGIDSLIIGKPMEAWRNHMPAGMFLKSEAFASSLSDPHRRYTFERFCHVRGAPYRPIGKPLALADFVDYADWFQLQAGVKVHDATLIDLRRTENGFELALANDDIVRAKRIILATGHMAFQHTAPVLKGLPNELVSHSTQHRTLGQFADKDVTIVGGGQSALETAVLLHELGAKVRVLARATLIKWPEDPNLAPSRFWHLSHPDAALGSGWRSLIVSEFPTLFRHLPLQLRHRYVSYSWGPAGAWWLKPRMKAQLPMLSSHEIVRAVERGGRVRLLVRGPVKQMEIDTDHVIAATGYRVDLDRLPFLAPALRPDITTFAGAPLLNGALQSSVTGLHFVGLASAQTFGPVMRFVYGAGHTAAMLTRLCGYPSERRRLPTLNAHPQVMLRVPDSTSVSPK